LGVHETNQKNCRFEQKNTETHLFRLIFGLFGETKKKFRFRSLRFFESVSKQPKQTDQLRNKAKKMNKTWVGGGVGGEED
jgi:hypothetical protein